MAIGWYQLRTAVLIAISSFVGAVYGVSASPPFDRSLPPQADIPGFANEWLLRFLCLSRVFIPKSVPTFGNPASHLSGHYRTPSHVGIATKTVWDIGAAMPKLFGEMVCGTEIPPPRHPCTLRLEDGEQRFSRSAIAAAAGPTTTAPCRLRSARHEPR